MTERLGSAAAAAHLKIRPSTWRDYVADGRAPRPDGFDEGFGRQYWLKSTLDAWQASRPRHGGRPATGVTPRRSVGVGEIWDEAEAIASARGEKIHDVARSILERGLRRYIRQHEAEGSAQPR